MPRQIIIPLAHSKCTTLTIGMYTDTNVYLSGVHTVSYTPPKS